MLGAFAQFQNDCATRNKVLADRIVALEESVRQFQEMPRRVQALEQARQTPAPVVPYHKDAEVHKWLTEWQPKLPLNNQDDMDAFEQAMCNQKWLFHARDHFATWGEKGDYKPLFKVLFGDWVTDNVTFKRPTVSNVF